MLSFLEMFLSERLLPQSDGSGFSYQPQALLAGLRNREGSTIVKD